MDNFKVIYSIPFLFFIIVSCSNSSTERVAKSKYDAKIAEYKELNEQQAAVIEDFNAIGIEKELESCNDIQIRMATIEPSLFEGATM